MITENNTNKNKGLENPKNNSNLQREQNAERDENPQGNKGFIEIKFEKFIIEKDQETETEVLNEEEITYKLEGHKKIGFWNLNQKKIATTDLLKINNFDIIGLNEVGKEVILENYTSLTVKDEDEKITCQLLCKKEIRIKKLECSQKGDFIAVEIDDESNQGCIIVVTYINPTTGKKE